MSIQSLCPFLTGLFGCFCCWVVWVCLFCILTLYQIHNLQIFSLTPQVAFSFYRCFPLLCRSLFVGVVPLLHFCLCSWCQNQNSRCQDQFQGGFMPVFSSRSLWFPAFNPFWINFCVWCVIVVWIHFFCIRLNPVSATSFIKETVIFSLYILVFFVVNNWPYICGFISGFFIVFHWFKSMKTFFF